ncbi:MULTISPECIES: 1-phosphofructokinase [Enterococcus]|uniref:1-phosphofructokinase n=1 Tax=Enterococcus TaxID=1350 RepID=UPI0002A3EDF5|nr:MULTISPECIES: 1-phosphofructokinase [Enterococcus]ELB05474.1 1-phosphofructokinase [Enterococcus faecium EnGen0028]MDT6323815.1 1-phosphofructokinase [Enterococcus faecium]HAQ4672478.1 1-phosphofructokinase [Enterococcus faecium]HAQ4706627.1 1-phosphofructokinase [Enterococcus faecium]HAR1638593.1 1-phosphofructokinase [Enterococcus faecium]
MTKIYTCTMNPAIDLFIQTDTMLPKIVNRTQQDDVQANGKGVNVSLVLKMMGIDNSAIGFSGGFTGRYIVDFLKEKGIDTDFVEVDGVTRINVFTHVEDQNVEYKLVNRGPKIKQDSMTELLEQIRRINANDFLCVSGSLPQGISPQIFVEISRICHKNKVNLIIDSSYPEILDCLPYRPFLLKPNEEELAGWFDLTEISPRDYEYFLRQVLNRGAQNILLSLGGEGAIFINEKNYLKGNSPKGKLVNSACAGDTLLATFLGGMVKGKELSGNLKKAIAAGSSTAFQMGLTDFSDVSELEEQIVIERGE